MNHTNRGDLTSYDKFFWPKVKGIILIPTSVIKLSCLGSPPSCFSVVGALQYLEQCITPFKHHLHFLCAHGLHLELFFISWFFFILKVLCCIFFCSFCVKTFQGHREWVRRVRVSNDGEYCQLSSFSLVRENQAQMIRYSVSCVASVSLRFLCFLPCEQIEIGTRRKKNGGRGEETGGFVGKRFPSLLSPSPSSISFALIPIS